MRVQVNWSLCDGNGLCAREAPDIFLIDDNDELHVRKETIEEADRDRATRAVKACPKAALSIVGE